MTMMIVFAATAALFFVIERVAPRQPGQPIFRRGFWVDVLYTPLHVLLRILVSFVLAGAFTHLGHSLGATPLLHGLPVLLQAVVVLLVLDFFFYWMHRAKHRWRWWWRLHETHHSSVDLDFLSSVRFHPLEKLLDRFVFLLPLTVLGASDDALLIWSAVDVFFGMLNHSNTRLRLGKLCYLFVGPDMHLWHHAKDMTQNDCNFGNNLAVFDWLFGTARLPARWPEEFGVSEPDYPQDSIFAQVAFAFRPMDEAPAVASPVVVGARAGSDA